jgi:hypothetical protein
MSSGQSHRTCSASGDNCHYPPMQEEFAIVSMRKHTVPEEPLANQITASPKILPVLFSLLKQGMGDQSSTERISAHNTSLMTEEAERESASYPTPSQPCQCR